MDIKLGIPLWLLWRRGAQGGPGDTPMELAALTHAHGAWIEALPPPYETRPYSMRTAVLG